MSPPKVNRFSPAAPGGVRLRHHRRRQFNAAMDPRVFPERRATLVMPLLARARANTRLSRSGMDSAMAEKNSRSR